MSDVDIQTNAPNGLWHRQFDESHDCPTNPIKLKLAFCTTPRCGSHFLGHKLHRLGTFGYPLEYLNPGNLHVWEKRAGTTPPFDFVKSVRTGPNGVFAVKLHHEHLSTFLQKESAPLEYKFIHLRRRSLTKQAISFSRAQQTGAWISDMQEMAPAKYDWAQIAEKMDAISRGNADWQSFLSSVGIQPLELFYEDIVEDIPSAIAQIANYLEIQIPNAPTEEATFEPRRQKKSVQDEWLSRFHEDSRIALAQGQPLPGVSHPSRSAILSRRTVQVAKKIRAKTGF